MDALPTSPCLSMVPSHFPESHAHRCRRRKVGKLRRICEETTTDQLQEKKKKTKKKTNYKDLLKNLWFLVKPKTFSRQFLLAMSSVERKPIAPAFSKRFRNTSPTVSDLMSLSRLFSEFLASRAPSVPLTPFSPHHHPLSASRFRLP